MSSGKFQRKINTDKKAQISADHDPAICDHKINGKLIHHKPQKATDGKKKISTFEIDGTKRELIVPSRKPHDVPVVLGQSQFNRLQKQAHVVTFEDRKRLLDEAEESKREKLVESQKRKQELAKAQQTQKAAPGTKLDTVESEATQKNQYLLQRSQQLMMEQDERVKQANGIILSTKCRAIRNLQISEKEQMKKDEAEEQKRLDDMMEQQRQKGLAAEEKTKEELEKKNEKYVTAIMQQIRENEIERILEAQRIDEESKMINKALLHLNREDEQKMQEKRLLQKQMREEFRKANSEAEEFRQIQQEEQRIADLRVQQFMRQKAEREEAREKELKLQHDSKEKEIGRLRAMQQRAQDHQAMMDELNALRNQEEKEKEWREKEMEAVRKKKEMMDDLKEARAQQIADIRKLQAVSLVRDEEDFHKVARIQRELHEKELAKRDKQKGVIAKHRKELLQQINEKERERIKEQQDKFEDGKAQRLEFEVKDRNIEAYLQHKIRNLKEKNVPEHFINDIERHLKIKK